MRVVVVGDKITDIYTDCEALGMSQEDPSIAVRPVGVQEWDGGATVVANHVCGLGHECKLITPERDNFKRRYRVQGKTLLRVNRVNTDSIDYDERRKIFDSVEKVVDATDLLLFADYNYGCLPNGLVNAITDLCVRHDVPMAADSQASSQTSDITRYRGMMLITPTEREARLALKDGQSDVRTLAKRLYAISGADNVIITLGANGSLGYDGKFHEQEALNQNPVDVCGAGDAMFVAASLALAGGESLEEALYRGAVASAIHIGKVGNPPLLEAEYESNLAGGRLWNPPEATNGQGSEMSDPGEREALIGASIGLTA